MLTSRSIVANNKSKTNNNVASIEPLYTQQSRPRDTEAVVQENHNLKETVSELQTENTKLKTQIHRLQTSLTKKGDQLNDLATLNLHALFSSTSPPAVNPAQHVRLIEQVTALRNDLIAVNTLNTHLQNIERRYESSNQTIKQLEKDARITRVKELEIINDTLMAELHAMKQTINQSINQSDGSSTSRSRSRSRPRSRSATRKPEWSTSGMSTAR